MLLQVSQILRSTNRYSLQAKGYSEEKMETAMGTQMVTEVFITTMYLVQHFLVKQCIILIAQLSYSPDLALSNFWLLPKLKLLLKEERFQAVDKIQDNVMRQLMVFSKDHFAN